MLKPTYAINKTIRHEKILYKIHHKIENMFGKLKDWRRIAMRYDRGPALFLSAIALF
jgi:transposase